jgi:prevent-host-death family protein
MTQVNIHDAKTHLSRLLEQVEAGEEVVISRAGRPIARLVAYRAVARPRRPGGWKGRVRVASDFDKLSPEIERAFRGDGE